MAGGVNRVVDADRQVRNDDTRWRGMFLTILGVTFVFGVFAMPYKEDAFPLALLVLGVTCTAALLRPVIGIYLLVFLALIGDPVTMGWWPFLKNMSSPESLLYVSDQVFLAPIELLAGATIVGWLARGMVDPTWRFVRGRLFWPMVCFTMMVFFGVLNGRAGGGDSRIAVFEFRAILYVPLIYLLVTNLFTTRQQYRHLTMLAFVAVGIQSIFSLLYYRSLSDDAKAELEDLGEHSATLHMNALIVFVICVWLFRGRGWVRWLSLLIAIPTLYAYVLAQRRAAMVALFAGLLIVFVALYFRRRRAFWFLAPTLVILTMGLVLATWNATGPIGLPAQAVRTVLFPNELGEGDQSSDMYRIIENYDLWFTIRADPITGIGFGQKFMRPVNLPDISFFEFYEYITHNSILWIWVKMGFVGFVTMLYLIARSVQLGARSMLAVRTPEQAAVVVAGLSYVVMFLVFAYVDIAWVGRTTVFLGFSMALCADFVFARDDLPKSRYQVHTRQLESLAR